MAANSTYIPRTDLAETNTPTGFDPAIYQALLGENPLHNTALKKTGKTAAAFSAFLPQILAAVNSSKVPSAQADLEASKAISDPLAALQTELYSKYAPQLAGTWDTINRNTQLSQAATERDVVSGAGRQTLNAAVANDQSANPEFYANRAAGSNALLQALSQAQRDSEGALSPTEIEQMNRFLAQQGAARGTGNSPSNTETINNALQFGELGQKRKQQGFANLSAAIQSAANFNPTTKSNLDTFGIASGRPVENAGLSQFTGVQSANNAADTANSFLNNTFGLRNTIEQGKIENQMSGWDKANAISGISGQFIGSIAKAFMGGV